MSGYRSRLFGFSFLVCCCAATACDDGGSKSCFENSDCQEGYVCRNEVCVAKVPPHCSNQLKDGDETDVDCGGSCAKCVNGKVCNAASDCENGQCENGRCTGEKALSAKPENLLINEVMGEPMSDETHFGYQTEGKQCDFVEIVNLLDQPQDLGGVTLVGKRTNGSSGDFSIALEGRIAAKGAHVVLNCGLAPIDGVSTQDPSKDNFITAGEAVYDIQLTKDGEEPGAVFHWAATKKKGNSLNLNPDRDKNGEPTLHSEVEEGALNSPGYCANGGLFIQDCQTVCSNGVKDEGESDVDCGGSCRKCDLGKKCESNDDCRSENCNLIGHICTEKPCTGDKDCANGLACDLSDNTCKTPETCSDGIKNQDETDVDCGGTKCAKCENGKTCNDPSDCVNGECEDGKCSGEKAPAAKPENLLINEVMSEPNTSGLFGYSSSGKQCDFIEIVNLLDQPQDLTDVVLTATRSSGSNFSIALEGRVAAKGAHVILEKDCSIEKIEGVSTQNATKINILTASNSYDIQLTKEGENPSAVFKFEPSGTMKGKSLNLNPDRDKNGKISLHSEVGAGVLNSPGYCANGGLFTEDCAVVDLCKNGEKDGDETDVDCGGTKCEACGLDKGCLKDGDCESGACDGGVCVVKKCTDDASCGDGKVCDVASGECRVPETCSDGKKNQDETDEDCGGEKCGACQVGKACKVNADCLSGTCSAQVCAGEDPQKADVSKLYVNEVMGSPKSGSNFAIQKEMKQCEFVEILNASEKKISVDGLTLVLEKCGNGKAIAECSPDKRYPLEGVVESDSFIVVAPEKISMPEDNLFVKVSTSISNGYWYKIYVTDGVNNSAKVVRKPLKDPNGLSQNRNNERAGMDGEEDLVFHNSAAVEGSCPAKENSPGYCANGGIYKYGCRVDASCNPMTE